MIYTGLYTICKFIRNNKQTYPMVSRSLGKIALPSSNSYIQLDPTRDNDTFWFVKILNEIGLENKGFIEVEPIQQVDPIPLIPGLFSSAVREHWVFLELITEVENKPFFAPFGIKHPFLQGEESKAVVCIPYVKESLAKFK